MAASITPVSHTLPGWRSRPSLRLLPWLLVGAVLVQQLVYVIAIPLYQGPDEVAHVAYVEELAAGMLPDVRTSLLAERVQSIRDLVEFNTYARITPDPDDAFAAAEAAAAGRPSDERNWIAQHPPAWYAGLLPAWAAGSPLGLRGQIYAIRLVSAMAGVAIVALAAWVTLRLSGSPLMATAAAAVAGFHPMFAFLFATVNNDAGAALAGAAGITWMVARWHALPDWKDALAVGAACGLGALSKVTFLPLGAVLLTTLLLLAWRARGPVRGVAVAGGAGLLAVGMAGWWYLRNLAEIGRPFPLASEILDFGYSPIALTPVQFLTDFQFPVVYFRRFWEVFTWITIEYPDWVYWLLAGSVLAAAAGWGLALTRDRPRWPRHEAGPLLFLLAAFLVMLAALTWQIYDLTAARGILAATHGRYLYPAMIPLAAGLGCGLLLLIPGTWRGTAAAGLVLVLGLGHAWLFWFQVIPAWYLG